jgi:hypothetical protein
MCPNCMDKQHSEATFFSAETASEKFECIVHIIDSECSACVLPPPPPPTHPQPLFLLRNRRSFVAFEPSNDHE